MESLGGGGVLCASRISLDVIYVGCNEGIEIFLSDVMVVGTTLVTYYGTYLGLL